MNWTDPEICGFAHNLAHKSAWCFKGMLDQADLVQEFAIVFVETKKLADEERGPAAFMSMFKQRCQWRLTDLKRQNRRTLAKGLQASFEKEDGHQGFEELVVREDLFEAEIEMILRDAKPAVQNYLRARLNGEKATEGRTLMASIAKASGITCEALEGQVVRWMADLVGRHEVVTTA